MRFAFVYRQGCEQKLVDFYDYLQERGHIIDYINPEYVIVLGGDGTILRAAREYRDSLDQIKMIGINFGKLGFYTDFLPDEFKEMISLIESNQYSICRLPLLKYEFTTDQGSEIGYALNEITVVNPLHTQRIDIYINNEMFESFKGTGIVISTPSGSTAYNKSLGGSVVDINLKAFQLTEIASINNRVFATLGSSMVFGEGNVINLKSPSFSGTTFTCDDLHKSATEMKELRATISDRYIQLVTKKNHSFWDRVKKAFLE